MDGHTGVGRRSGLWGAPALTQEEVLMLVVVRQVFQLLLAVLRREAETVNPSTPRTPDSRLRNRDRLSRRVQPGPFLS